MHPIKLILPSRLALLVCLALPFSPAPAQDKPAGQASKTITVASAPETLSIDFPGGPLSKLVVMLAAREGTALSIIQSEGLDPTLPAFSLREVHIPAVIAALGRLLEPQGFGLVPTGPNLAVLSRQPERVLASTFASFQLENKIGQRLVEEVIAAIQQGCEFASADGKSPTLRFKYHPGTKLLFVAGQPAEVDIAYKVFDSLPNNPERKPSPPAEKK